MVKKIIVVRIRIVKESEVNKNQKGKRILTTKES